jgi:hypothetical protein
MTSHDSADTLTALVPERVDNDIIDRTRAADCMASGWPGIERVVMNDIAAPVTTVGRRRGTK